MGNPLFLVGLTGVAYQEVRHRITGIPRWLSAIGLVFAILSWGREIGSASGLFFLEPLILAYIPAYILLGLYTLRIAIMAQRAVVASPASGAGAAR